MARYIDSDKLIKTFYNIQNCPITTLDVMNLIELVPTADVVEEEKITEYITDKLTKEISERIIQFLEANYEIIPKKSVSQVSEYRYKKAVEWEPMLRCKDCKNWDMGVCIRLNRNTQSRNWCDFGERK